MLSLGAQPVAHADEHRLAADADDSGLERACESQSISIMVATVTIWAPIVPACSALSMTPSVAIARKSPTKTVMSRRGSRKSPAATTKV